MIKTDGDLAMPELPAEPQAEACFRLIYRSRSLLPDESGDSDASLASILHVSRINNHKSDVTGALVLYAYRKRFAQVLEGAESDVLEVFERVKSDKRHDNIEIHEADPAPARLFSRWAMAMIVEHNEPDVPLVATVGGLAEASPWRVTADQEQVLMRLRELTRGYGRAY